MATFKELVQYALGGLKPEERKQIWAEVKSDAAELSALDTIETLAEREGISDSGKFLTWINEQSKNIEKFTHDAIQQSIEKARELDQKSRN